MLVVYKKRTIASPRPLSPKFGLLTSSQTSRIIICTEMQCHVDDLLCIGNENEKHVQLTKCDIAITFTFTYHLTVEVAGTPQMNSQWVFSIFLCSPVLSWTWRTPGLLIPWCCLPTSSTVCLVFFPLSLCLGRCFWSDLMNGRHAHTTAICFASLYNGQEVFMWSNCLLDLGTDFLIGNMVFVWDA